MLTPSRRACSCSTSSTQAAAAPEIHGFSTHRAPQGPPFFKVESPLRTPNADSHAQSCAAAMPAPETMHALSSGEVHIRPSARTSVALQGAGAAGQHTSAIRELFRHVMA
eukprot:scaffold52768_cov30-Tisochrysis_lutea.AAC.2